MTRIYLDHNATTPLRSEARTAMLAAMDVAGNPSSVHAEGRAARGILERARTQVAAAVGCQPDEVVFTSGATEAAGVLAETQTSGGVIVDETAHDALWAWRRSPDQAASSNGPGPILAMGLASGETGVVNGLPSRVGGWWSFGGALADSLLIDVTQAVGRMPFAFGWSGADLAILSAHKLGGPKGVGALIVRDGYVTEPLQRGGGQEMRRRSGTENVIGIAGFGAAAEAAQADLAAGRWDEVAQLRNILEGALAAESLDTIFVGKDGPRLPNTSCLIASGWKGETQVMAMDLAGFAVSAGSACSSGKVRSSRVLAAMGFDEAQATSALRVSLGLETTQDQVMRFAAAWGSARRRQQARAA